MFFFFSYVSVGFIDHILESLHLVQSNFPKLIASEPVMSPLQLCCMTNQLIFSYLASTFASIQP
uniref:Uncharacterized protein n=1 Tax=Rhizophora mucronata TaxID=61149 RepID=A0A2P2QNI5_RHIMU